MDGSRLTSLFLLTAAVMAGCANETTTASGTEENIGRHRQPIINGTTSSEKQDFVLQLGLQNATGKIDALCSSSLVAKNLLLTARHCVGDLDPNTVTMTSTFDAKLFAIYTGKDGPQQIEQNKTPAARGKKVFTPSTTSLFPDVALILLDKDVTAPIAHLRLTESVKKDETVNVVGYGMNESNGFNPVRMEKPNMKIIATFPEVTTFHQLNQGEFVFGEAACFGDSGGPAVSSKTNAVVGVASRVNSGEEGTQAEPNKPCVGGSTEDVYTGLLPFKALVDQAFAEAGAKPLLEGEPDPVPEKPKATTPKSSDAPSDEEEETEKKPTRRVTGPPIASSGCSSSPSSTTTFAPVLGALAGLMMLSRRRRR